MLAGDARIPGQIQNLEAKGPSIQLQGTPARTA